MTATVVLAVVVLVVLVVLVGLVVWVVLVVRAVLAVLLEVVIGVVPAVAIGVGRITGRTGECGSSHPATSTRSRPHDSVDAHASTSPPDTRGCLTPAAA